jgi:hypothetical protein
MLQHPEVMLHRISALRDIEREIAWIFTFLPEYVRYPHAVKSITIYLEMSACS